MRKRIQCVLALLMASGAATPLHAQTPATNDDLQCIYVLSLEQQATPDASKKSGFLIGVFYFLGRIDGREPGLTLESALRNTPKQFQSLTAAQRQSAVTRCNQLLLTRDQVFTAAARDIVTQPK